MWTKKLCFSPLAGISYVETQLKHLIAGIKINVSVPLRGLVMWKQLTTM